MRATFIWFSLLVFVCQFRPAQAQEYHYRVLWKNDSIGFVQTNRFDSADLNVYKIYSEATFWLLGTKKIVSHYTSIFGPEDVLLHANTYSTKNGAARNASSIQKTNEGYTMQSDGDVKPNYLDGITMSIAKLYYEEPNQVTSILSERYAEMLPVKKVSPNVYSMTKPNGRDNEYHYADGKCIRVEVEHFFAHVTFELIE